MANGDGDLKVVDSQPLPDLSVVSSGAIPPESMMHRWWRGLTTPLPRTPGSDEEAVREGSGPALTGLSTIGLAGVPIEAIAARSLAPLAPLVKGAIGSAAGSWLGGKAGSVIGQEKAGSTIGGLAGALYGGSGGKIPTNMAELETVMQSPEAKARAAQEVEGQETVDAIKMQDVEARRIAREQAAAGRQKAAADTAAQKAALTPKATPAQPVAEGTNYGQYLKQQEAAAKAAAQAQKAAAKVEAAAREPVPLNQSPYYAQNQAAIADAEAARKPVSLNQSPYYTQNQAAQAAAEAEAARKTTPLSPIYGPQTPTADQLTGTPDLPGGPRGFMVVPEPRPNFAGETEGYMGSVPRETLPDLAMSGKPGAGRQLQQLGEDILYSPRPATGSSAARLAALRELAAPALKGGPGDFTSQAAEPQWAYRTRDVGEAGVPADARSPAHATSSFEQAQRFAESRNPGKPQEIVRFNTNSLKPGELSAQPFSDSVDWYRLHRPLAESEVEVVQPAEQESE